MNSAPVFVGEVLSENLAGSQQFGFVFWLFMCVGIALCFFIIYLLYKNHKEILEEEKTEGELDEGLK